MATLFVNVSIPANVAKVPVAPGRVIVVIPAVAGAAKVAVPEDAPLKPTLEICVNALFDNVSAPAKVAKVPELGKVTFVVPVDVKVVANSPAVDRFPANVIVLAPLFIPVPPYVPPIKVPFQVPAPIVPTVVITLEPAAGEAPRFINAFAVVVAPVPPDATGSVPVVKTDVELAYTAPPLVKLVNPVPPLLVPIAVALQVPVVIVPTALKVEMLVNVLLEVAVIFPAVVAVDAFPVVF